MADSGPPERREPDPFDFGWIFNAMSGAASAGPVNWDVAERLATSLAAVDPDTNEPRPDPPVAAETAGALRGLVDAAQSYVSGATGLSTVLAVPVQVVTRAEWTRITLHGLRPVLGALAEAVSPGGDAPTDPFSLGAFGAPGAGDPMQAMLQAFAPMLFGMQAGTLVGMLSQYALGQYDLPLPLAGTPELAFISANIDAFTDDWSLPRDDLHFALALRETVHAAERSVPWVRERLLRLSVDFVSRYELRPEAFEEQFGSIDPGALDLSGLDLSKLDPATFDPATFDPSSLGLGNLDFSAFEEQLGGIAGGDPGELLAAMRTPEQAPLLAELQRFGAVLAGYADIVVTTIGGPLVPDLGRIDEALRRHRVERGRVASFVDQMLGLALDREHYDAGHAFCEGVVERAGLEGLNRVWEDEAMVPTPSELEAPGLWLARIEL